jgi:hypothetical protein
MNNNRMREINDVNVQIAVDGAPLANRRRMPARHEDGKGGRMDLAANNVTMIAINVSLSGAAQPGSVQKAKADFDGLFYQALGGSTFERNDRARLNELTAKHREGLTNEADRTAFDNVVGAFNDSWGGKKFGKEDWARFNARVAGLSDVTAPVAQAPAAVPTSAAAPVVAAPEPQVPASLTHEYFDKYYAPLYEGDVARANEVRKDLHDMQT